MPFTAVYIKPARNWLGLLDLPCGWTNTKQPPFRASKINKFTTFYLFLLWIDTCPGVFNYVCIRAGPVLTGSGDHDEDEEALERANPVDADLGTRRRVARRSPGDSERR